MKAKRISMLVFVLLVAMSATAMAAKWEWICSADGASYYFDSDSVTYKLDILKKMEKDVVCCWEKFVFAPQSAEKYAKEFNDKRFLKLSHVLIYSEYDTIKKTKAEYELIFYNDKGEVLIEGDSNGKPKKIIPGTRAESIFKYIVEYCKAHDEEITVRSKGEK